MNCEEASRYINSYMDNLLDEVTQRRLEQHLAKCVICQNELDVLVKAIRIMRTLEPMEPPRDYTKMINQRVSLNLLEEGE